MTSPAPTVLTRDLVRVRTVVAVLTGHAPTAAVVATLAWWATGLTWGTGGREPHVLSLGCGLLLASSLLVRPWRRLPTAALLLGHGLGLAAFTVVLTAPTGTEGLHEAASYAFAGQLGLVVLAWATSPARRTIALGAVLVAAASQFTQGWLPWWGLQDPSRLFQGTFYWHNQAGIFLAAGALLAFAVVAQAHRPLHPLGWVVTPLTTAGVVYTTSRGSQLGLALGLVLLTVAILRSHDIRRAAALRLTGVTVVAWTVTTLLTGPPFFPERVSATAATAARADSFVANGVQRFEDWRRAVAIFVEWPVTGAGFYSYDSATVAVTTKRDGVSTAFAHNGFLQALSDGGLVLAVPLFVAVGLILLLALRALPEALRAGDLVRVGAGVAFLVLMLHSGMDFDWTYPALLSLATVVGVLALPVPAQVDVPPPRARASWAAVTVLLLAVAAVGAWPGGLQLNAVIPAG
jgi:O-antigen ligase